MSAEPQQQQRPQQQETAEQVRDAAILKQIGDLFEKRDAAMQSQIEKTVNASFADFATQWKSQLDDGLKSLRDELQNLRKQDNASINARLSSLESSVATLRSISASAPAAAGSTDDSEQDRKRRAGSAAPRGSSQPARTAAPAQAPVGTTPAGIPRGQNDRTKVWSSLFPRPMLAKVMTSHAEKALNEVPIDIRHAATIRTANLNKNYYIEFDSPRAATRFLEHMKDRHVVWTDPKGMGDDADIRIHFKADRSLPERQLGQVMGEFFQRVGTLIRDKNPEKKDSVKILSSKPKGIVFASDGDDIITLATAQYTGEGSFTLKAESSGMQHFHITPAEAEALISATRTALAARSVSI